MTTQAQPETQPEPIPVEFQISTYWKLRRGEPGLTRMDSRRLLLSEALDWVLSELPEGSVTVDHDTAEYDIAQIRIDWSKVPEAIRYGGRS